ncbi:hypothetical protein, partial [Corallococcus llansteffanensis]|uniref:hypothetical protein n=1 Tax=Corallococcus llansteffanensis TaxID=2316731 RepID=UPI001FC8EFC1
ITALPIPTARLSPTSPSALHHQRRTRGRARSSARARACARRSASVDAGTLPQAWAEPKPEEASEPPEAGARQEPTQEGTPQLDGAGLLRRSFALDVFGCGRCGGRRRVLASLTAPDGVRALLEHLGLPTAGARLAPSRGPLRAAWC